MSQLLPCKQCGKIPEKYSVANTYTDKKGNKTIYYYKVCSNCRYKKQSKVIRKDKTKKTILKILSDNGIDTSNLVIKIIS